MSLKEQKLKAIPLLQHYLNTMTMNKSITREGSESSGLRNSIRNETIEDWSDQLFFVTSYTDFDKLAHGPRGTNASHSLYVYRFNSHDGSMLLLNIQGDAKSVINPAFSRHHPRMNVVYTCTEDIEDNGKIFAYRVGPGGELTSLGKPVDAGGTSTCYLTIDRAQKNILAVNYWDSSLVSIPISRETGEFEGPVSSVYDPREGKAMIAHAKKFGGVNHSNNDSSTIKQRQVDPHSHAIVLDPYVGVVAYVPDLGKDVIREFFYDRESGKIGMQLNVLPSGLCTGMADGPRYCVFHPIYNIAYVVNELSSTVAVFEVDHALLREISSAARSGENMAKYSGRSTLRLVQSISTIPEAFPTQMNTCGRIACHPSGRYVVVSNRGHESITIFRVKTKGSRRGDLTVAGHYHTRGETPRHFHFDSSGQYIIVANQDSDSVAVFSFNLSSGDISYTGNEYRVPSPNFVCCCPMHNEAIEPLPLSIDLHAAGEEMTPQSCESSDAESESSTFRSKANKKGLQTELDKARKEIENLKQKLASLNV